MKKAFSLIEIMQTIILLGIIAGLSISFFKKMNTNEKLWNSTQLKLTAAIEEANRQMCSDDTPTCYVSIGGSYFLPYSLLPQADANALCRTVYPDSTYDSESKYCVKTVAAADTCPEIPEAFAGRDYDVMVKKADDNTKCFATPPCASAYAVQSGNSSKNPATGVITYEDNTSTYKAFPLSAHTCVNNVPNYQANVTSSNLPALCYYLHSLLIHKPQGFNYDSDLIRTCSGTTPFYVNESPMTTLLVNNQVADREAHGGDNYSMLLPNGVYLYNLGGNFRNAENLINIYVKYDRVQTTKSAKYVVSGANFDSKKSTMGVLPIKNPTAVKIEAAAGGGGGAGGGGAP